jgi:cell division protein ZapA (FtsZ GTPase activity inhibitor)
MNNTRSYTIRILNDQYIIESDDSEEFVLSAVQRIDTHIRQICAGNDIDPKRVYILVALRLSGQLIRLEQDLMNIHQVEKHLISLVDSVC